MLISKIGEFGLIERFRRKIKTDPSVVVGSGDDCAVLKFDKRRYQLFTCDMLVEGIDFTKNTDPYLIGRKSVAVSISDIASCCGEPTHCLVSLGLPENTNLKTADGLFEGIFGICKKYHINLVGGDLSSSEKIVIDVSMLGLVDKNKLTLRSKAQDGDIIFVTGSLGGSIRGRHLCFEPRLKEARFLAHNFKVNAMIDISDGLVQDLGHILEQSKVGGVIYENLLPISKDANGINEAFYMGEDFELLFTLPKDQSRRLLDKRKSGFYPIGEIIKKKSGLTLIDKKANEVEVKSGGFRHF
ncbi:MAG: thiamine-monophosphate kinase [Candidatus Omnitrophica bacterium]|nr:thiamine-monophosphate kinase [Candidatus Omnitrophota bacterium]